MQFIYKKVTPMKNIKQFSKKLLALDYIIAGILIFLFVVCLGVNGVYTIITTNQMIQMGVDISMVAITAPFNLEVIATVLGVWIGQLGISSLAYYYVVKNERKVELPMRLVQTLPDEIKEQVDMNNLISTVLTSTSE